MGVPKAVPSAVVPSTANTVAVNTEPGRGPYTAPDGNPVIPVVPRSDGQEEKNLPRQPHYGGAVSSGGPAGSGSAAAPSVPVNGFLFTQGPIDPHYADPVEARNPYGKVNNPPTRGMFTFIKSYLNHIAYAQRTDETGFKESGPQQRTSYMRVTPPPHGVGYAPEIYDPRQLPQSDNTYKYGPVTGTDPYGSGVLNSDTYGAGQTAGGIGGSNYTPAPGPPSTTSTAGQGPNPSGMPIWG